MHLFKYSYNVYIFYKKRRGEVDFSGDFWNNSGVGRVELIYLIFRESPEWFRRVGNTERAL